MSEKGVDEGSGDVIARDFCDNRMCIVKRVCCGEDERIKMRRSRRMVQEDWVVPE